MVAHAFDVGGGGDFVDHLGDGHGDVGAVEGGQTLGGELASDLRDLVVGQAPTQQREQGDVVLLGDPVG